MLNGLEATELKLSEALDNSDFRIDAEFHRRPPISNPLYAYVKVGEILRLAQYGISIEMNEDGKGYLIYRMNEITNMLCNADVAKFADIKEDEAAPFVLQQNDILFNRTNSQEFVGRTGIFKKFSNEPYVFASYLIRLKTDESKVLPEYLTAFLNTEHGRWDIKRRARISINQSNVNAEEIKAIKIPLLSIRFQSKLRIFFDIARQKLDQSKALYAEAENLLLDELGLKDWQPMEETIAVKSFAESFGSTGRLDAEYYQPKYEMLHNVLSQRFMLERIGDWGKVLKGKSPEYTDDISGVPVIRSGDLSDIDNERNFLRAIHTKGMFRLEVGDVLISSIGFGSIGKVQVFDKTGTYSTVSEVTVIRQKRVNPYYLCFYLQCLAGQFQINRFITGATGQLHLYPRDVGSIFVPIVTDVFETKLMNLFMESRILKKQSAQMLELAKRGVEMAIESDEAKALAWMESEMAGLAL